MSGVFSPDFDSWFESRWDPSRVAGDKVIAAATAARHPKSRREIGEARVAQRFSTRGEFGGEEFGGLVGAEIGAGEEEIGRGADFGYAFGYLAGFFDSFLR